MVEPWKVSICENSECLAKALDSEGHVEEYYKLYPILDTPEEVKFQCHGCGEIKSWGPQRQTIAKKLYKRYS